MLHTCVLLLGLMSLAMAGVAGPAAADPLANLVGVVYSEASSERIAHASVWLCDALRMTTRFQASQRSKSRARSSNASAPKSRNFLARSR